MNIGFEAIKDMTIQEVIELKKEVQEWENKQLN